MDGCFKNVKGSEEKYTELLFKTFKVAKVQNISKKTSNLLWASIHPSIICDPLSHVGGGGSLSQGQRLEQTGQQSITGQTRSHSEQF